MIGGLVGFLIGCLVLVIVIYVAHLVLGMLALPDPINKIVLLIVGLVGLLVLLGLLFGGGGGFVAWR